MTFYNNIILYMHVIKITINQFNNNFRDSEECGFTNDYA